MKVVLTFLAPGQTKMRVGRYSLMLYSDCFKCPPIALSIHISSTTKETLDKLGGFHTEERGKIPLKVTNEASVLGYRK